MADQDQAPAPGSIPASGSAPAPESADVAQETQEESSPSPKYAVKIEDSGPARKTLTIEVPQDLIQAKIEENFSTLSNDAPMPGFRRGRAPRRLLERRFGSTVRQDVKAQLISEAYSQAVDDHKLDVLGEPVMKDAEQLELPEDGPMTFTVEVEVAPVFDLPELQGLELTRKPIEVADQDVEQQIETLRERQGQMREVAEAQVQTGDFLRGDVHVYAGENAGEDAEVLAHHHDSYVHVPGERTQGKGHIAGIVVEGLSEHLVGKPVGDEVRISLTGPASHENEKIKGQPITISLKINSVERLEPMSLADLLEQADLESEEVLRQRVREQIQQQREREQQADLHEQAIQQLEAKVNLQLPEGLTGRQTEGILRRQAMELAYRGRSPQQVEEHLAEMRTQSEEAARKQLTRFFILDRVAKDLDVDVSQGEINGRIAMLANYRGRRPEKMRQEMLESGELQNLYLSLREQKTLDRLVEQATVRDAEGGAAPQGEQAAEGAAPAGEQA